VTWGAKIALHGPVTWGAKIAQHGGQRLLVAPLESFEDLREEEL
jgi:hypothetical protein